MTKNDKALLWSLFFFPISPSLENRPLNITLDQDIKSDVPPQLGLGDNFPLHIIHAIEKNSSFNTNDIPFSELNPPLFPLFPPAVPTNEKNPQD
jgi:hypothetical protein